jgi:hypothetical protein
MEQWIEVSSMTENSNHREVRRFVLRFIPLYSRSFSSARASQVGGSTFLRLRKRKRKKNENMPYCPLRAVG